MSKESRGGKTSKKMNFNINSNKYAEKILSMEEACWRNVSIDKAISHARDGGDITFNDFASVDELDRFVSSFPKYVKVKPTKYGQLTAYFYVDHKSKVTGPVNELAEKRVKKLAEIVKDLQE